MCTSERSQVHNVMHIVHSCPGTGGPNQSLSQSSVAELEMLCVPSLHREVRALTLWSMLSKYSRDIRFLSWGVHGTPLSSTSVSQLFEAGHWPVIEGQLDYGPRKSDW